MSLAEISQAIVSHSNLLLVFFATLRDQLHPTLCDSMDCSPPGSSVHGIFQARILEWVAISFSNSYLLLLLLLLSRFSRVPPCATP